MDNYCQECRDRLYPENPSIKVYFSREKRTLPALCDCCEHPHSKEVPVVRITQNQKDFNSLKGEMLFLRNKVNDLYSRSALIDNVLRGGEGTYKGNIIL